MTGPHIAIVGGGITGLAAAYRILELSRERANPVRITLIEAGDRPGGVISTLRQDDLIIERGPDSIITQKPWGMALCKRLGLEDRIVGTSQKNRGLYVVNNKRLVSVPEGFLMMAPTNWWSFLSSPLFSMQGKLRMALDLVLPRGEDLPDETLSGFVTRRLGREALDRIAQPLVGGIYTADPGKLSLRATMPRFLDLERKYGSIIRGLTAERRQSEASTKAATGARYSMFTSLDQGLQVLVDRLTEEIKDIRLNSRVTGLARDDAGIWRIRLSNDEVLEAQAVIIATPVGHAAALLAETDLELSLQLAKIQCASSAVLNLVFKRTDIPQKLKAFGFVVPAAEQRSILACTFSSVKFENRSTGDRVLMRVFLGGAMQPQVYSLSDEDMMSAARTDLKDLLGITAEPAFTLITRYPDSMPQYDVGHLDRVEQIERRVEQIPGLALAGNAYRGVGIPDCIHSGEQAAERMFPLLSR